MSTATVLTEQESVRPFWIPAGVDFESLPPDMHAAIIGIINPAYRDLVLSAEPGLVQSTGLTIVHLLWLEILQQIELGSVGVDTISDAVQSENRDDSIGRYLRIAGAKIVSSAFLLRLREFRQKYGSFSYAPDPLRREKSDDEQ